MWKKTFLTAASAAVITCGAFGVAHAGELKLKLRDVNIQGDEPSDTQHTDTDAAETDINGNFSPNGNVAPRDARSVDKPFDDSTHVYIAEERMGGVSNPIGGFYEIDVFEVTGAATFTQVTRFDISVGGSADPWFKEDVNCANAIRSGSDQVFSLSANNVGANGGITAGTNSASCNVTIQQGGNGLSPDRTIGWVLPIEIKNCVDGAELIVAMTVRREDPVTDEVTVDDIEHPIAVCKDSVKADFAGSDLKIDYFTDFRSFLVGEEHEPALYATVGRVFLDLHHTLVDLKEEDKNSHTNVFDVSDVASWDIVFGFDDLQGIKDMCIEGEFTDVCADQLDYVLDEVRFFLTNQEIRDLFGLETANGFDKGGKDEGFAADITLHAFGPNSSNPNNGPIDHQLVVVSSSEINLTPTACIPAHCVKFFSPEIEGEGRLIADLQKTGISFGPNDWVADRNSMVQSVFRVTGIPKENVADLKGTITVENASDGKEFDAVYKVDYPDELVVNHELLLTPPLVTQLLADAGMPDAADWGRADLTFTFFVGREGIKMDMDRLIFTNGVFTSFGDNANDATSLKARSCDDGRFGPHVANKVDPRFTGLLTFVCGLGEISRREVFLGNDE